MEAWTDEFLLEESRLRVPGWQTAPLVLHLIVKGGSDRFYYRVEAHGRHEGPDSAILMVYTHQRPDNASFFAATEVLELSGANAPCIYFHDETRRLAWIEDLGRRDLWDHRTDVSGRVGLYEKALREVACLHRLQAHDLPEHLRCQLQPPFDTPYYGWEQDYFLEQFVARFSIHSPVEDGSWSGHDELSAMRHELAALPRFLVHRDFQSQNIIVQGDRAWMIDYQGLREGRPEYDVASLLYDPYVDLSEAERRSLAAAYFAHRRDRDGWHAPQEVLAMCACQRLMQALGAYGKLGVADGKTAFLKHIPPALANLRGILQTSGLLPSLLPLLELNEAAFAEAEALCPS